MYLADLLKINLTKFEVISVRRQKAVFLSPRSSKIIVTKEKERRKISVFHQCSQMRRNTRRYWTQQTLPIVTCSFIRLNDAFRKTLLKAGKKTLRQPTTRAEFSLMGALISN